jgi:Ca2+-binding RTX toxin-like protein
VLSGGVGNDALSGGSGRDLFTFDSALSANIDRITDFVVADDTVQLENSIFTKLSKTGVLNSGMFVKAVAPHDANDYLIYNPATGALSYDADGNGTGASVQIAVLGVNLPLTYADFVVI